MFFLVSSKFLAMRNITFYSVQYLMQILHCTIVTQISTDTESGVESTNNISDNINNNPECDGIEVVTNNPFTLVHNGREGLSKIGSDIIGYTRHSGHEKSGIIPKLSEIGPQKPVIQEEGGSSNSAATVVSARTARKRRIAGIFQHYYPEGGWGVGEGLTARWCRSPTSQGRPTSSSMNSTKRSDVQHLLLRYKSS